MELQTATQVSQDYGVSTRMLRYYEQIGLIKSNRKDDYAYRVYDDTAIKQIQQIIILRKLQIPVNQIRDILRNQNAVGVIEIFKQNISEIDEQMTALSAIKSILARFVDELQEKADIHLKLDILNDKTMLAVVSSLPFSENKIKEKVSMEELNKASETLDKLADKEVNFPPAAVSSEYEGELNNQPNFEIVKIGPYRFIGKSVYARAHDAPGTNEVFHSLWQQSDWVYKKLDDIKEYASDVVHKAMLYHWERYDPEKNQLTGCTVGKFMKPDTPVPDDLDYIDLPESYVAKGWGEQVGENVDEIIFPGIEQTGVFDPAIWKYYAHIMPDPPYEVKNVWDVLGKFIPCEPKPREENK